jgi:hypothetical protein
MSHEWMTQAKQNILFLDNALISQKRGVFVDHGGLFARSNLCRDAGEEGSHWAADFYARREFGWRAFREGDVAGPILVCLQCEADSSVTQGFLPGRESEGRMVEFLRQVKTHLPFPSHRVIIRPHPREKPACLPPDAECEGWSWANEETFAEVLPRCRAVVTVNSTCAHEAVLAGVPVATLGTGTFTGWGVTLECAGNPARLGEIANWRPEPSRAEAYVCRAMTRHFLPYEIREGRINEEFNLWLKAA